MAKKNYYGVKKGKTPGIYLTWEECKSQVEGVSGAVYKGFSSREEAERFVYGEALPIPEKKPFSLPPGEAVAYVDGSYNEQTGKYGGGIVFLHRDGELHISKPGEREEYAEMRNVAGEILGAVTAMQEAKKRGIKKLTIVHDYQGIASWCTGEWKTNKEGTAAYKAYYDSLQGSMDIQFKKVKGHSGDAYNELADELAKEAVLL